MAPLQQVRNLPHKLPSMGGRTCGVGRPGKGTGRGLHPSPHALPLKRDALRNKKAAIGYPARLLRLCFGLPSPRPGFARAAQV